MNDKYYLSETNKILIIGISIIFIFASIVMLTIAYFSFKTGYETAVKDYHKNNIKCEVVNDKVIWKKKK